MHRPLYDEQRKILRDQLLILTCSSHEFSEFHVSVVAAVFLACMLTVNFLVAEFQVWMFDLAP